MIRKLFLRGASGMVLFVCLLASTEMGILAFDDIRSTLMTLYGEVPSETRIEEGRSPGESASGIILQESSDELHLDTQPCSGRIVPFRKPYQKESIGNTTCEVLETDESGAKVRRKKSFAVYQVQQK